MPPHECVREPLANSNVGFVELCSCGSVHLGIGPLTIRIDPGTFEHVARMMRSAQERLHSLPISPDTASRIMRIPTDAT
jgi:hypothetical protein